MEARRTPSYNESLQQNQKHSSSSGILSFNNCKDVHAKKKKKIDHAQSINTVTKFYSNHENRSIVPLQLPE